MAKPTNYTIDEEQDDLINLANDLARKKLKDGTASSPIITHFLELGSDEYQHEKRMREIKREKAELENELLKAKTENLKANTSSEKLYADAIKAFSLYNGGDSYEEDY